MECYHLENIFNSTLTTQHNCGLEWGLQVPICSSQPYVIFTWKSSSGSFYCKWTVCTDHLHRVQKDSPLLHLYFWIRTLQGRLHNSVLTSSVIWQQRRWVRSWVVHVLLSVGCQSLFMCLGWVATEHLNVRLWTLDCHWHVQWQSHSLAIFPFA